MYVELKAGLFIVSYLGLGIGMNLWLRKRIERNIAAGRPPLRDK